MNIDVIGNGNNTAGRDLTIVHITRDNLKLSWEARVTEHLRPLQMPMLLSLLGLVSWGAAMMGANYLATYYRVMPLFEDAAVAIYGIAGFGFTAFAMYTRRRAEKACSDAGGIAPGGTFGASAT